MYAEGLEIQKSKTVTIPDVDSHIIIPDTGVSNNFLTAISDDGVITKRQPTFDDLNGVDFSKGFYIIEVK